MKYKISYQYLTDPDKTRMALKSFAGQPVIGLDTETYHDAESKRNCLSLIQLASPTGEVVVIDAFSAGVEEVRELIESDVSMVAHNAGFDNGVLRAAGFDAAGLIDTMKLARRTLEIKSFSLAYLSSYLIGIDLDKTHQRSDWLRRPLSREQLDYAALDAVITLRIYLELTAQLKLEGRLDQELIRAQVRKPELADIK